MRTQCKTGLLAPMLAVASLATVWVSDAEAAPGDHIRTGNAEIIPYLDVLAAYRTNAYLQEGELGGGQPIRSGAYVQFTPGLDMSISGDDATFDFGVAYHPRKYLSPELTNLDRFKDVDLGARLKLLPSGLVGLNLSNTFRVTGRETEATNASDSYITHLRNETAGSVHVRPGGSMDIGLGGFVEFDDYDVPPSLNVQGITNLNDRLAYGPRLAYRWKFLPKTAVVADVELGWFDWSDNYIFIVDTTADTEEDRITDFGEYLAVPNGNYWRGTAGLRGRFTSKLILGVVAGYGQMNFDDQSVIDDATSEGGADPTEYDPATAGFGTDVKGFPGGLLLTADAQYSLAEQHKITVGYVKDFDDAFFTNAVQYGYLYGRYDGTFADKLSARAEAGVRFEDYIGEITRTDNVLRVRTDLSYAVTDYLDVGGGVWWVRRVNTGGQFAQEFDDLNIHLAVGLAY